MCCLIFSRKGLAYFGVLVQLLVGLLIIPLITLLIAFTIGPSKDGTGKLLTSSEISFIALYCCALCTLAAIIFRGIRSESLSTLYMSMAALIILQLSAGVVTLLSWKPRSNSDPMEVLVRIFCLTFYSLSSLIYLVILTCYTKHVRNKLNEDFEEEDFYTKS